MWKPKNENWKSNLNGGTTNQNQSVQRCFPNCGIVSWAHFWHISSEDFTILRHIELYIIGEVDNISRRHRALGYLRAEFGEQTGSVSGRFPRQPSLPTSHTFAALLRFKAAERPTSAKRGILETFRQHPPTNLPPSLPFLHSSLSVSPCAL